ncbi:MAG: SMC-Scp complex subunit ScpB, partial [Christensenellales bacterium]|jgi:segregation and condensation protein B
VQLLARRGLIEECGRRETLGRPIEYRTTDRFLMHFGIESLAQLPDLNDAHAQADAQEDAPKGPFEG